MYIRAADAPIWHCEEFDDRTRETAPRSALAEVGDTNLAAMTAAAEPAGLCNNCDNRQTCAHLRDHGSVWHCEEYR